MLYNFWARIKIAVTVVAVVAAGMAAAVLRALASYHPLHEAWVRFRPGARSREPRKVFGPVKPFLDHLYPKTEKFIRLKLIV